MHLGMRVLSIRGDQTSKTALFSSREAGNDLNRHVSMIVETDNLNTERPKLFTRSTGWVYGLCFFQGQALQEVMFPLAPRP